MNRSSELFRKIVEYVLPWVSLAFLLTYSYVKFFKDPYGFGWEGTGQVYIVYTNQPSPTLMVGDELVKIGPLTWEAYNADLRKTFFDGVKPGETVPIVVQRNHQTLTIPWTVPGTTQGEIVEQLFSEWFLAYVFWVAGALTLLFLRPKDERWRLLATFNFLTAIWLESGGGASNYHLLYSALVLRMAVWISIPIYLHLHWVFPRPLGKLPPILVAAAYTGAIVLMIAQGFQALPPNLYFLGFLVAVLGSLILLVLHAVLQVDSRQELRILWVAVLFALAPVVVVSATGMLNGSARADSLAFLTFPALPLSYLYAAYRRQLGGLEVRVNRLISIYLFLILLVTIATPAILAADHAFSLPDDTFILGAACATIATLAAIFGFPAFQSFVDRRWLGISLPSKQLPQIYSRRATASTSIIALLDLIEKDILPSLLIREFMFLRLEGAAPEVLLAVGLSEDQIRAGVSLLDPTQPEAKPSAPPPSENAQAASWVRIKLPLRVGDNVLGYWLFGRRDPDDHYHQAEVSILQSLADQTGITLSNIIQTERLRMVYQTDINRYEQERLRLALELHDGILNKIAVLLMKLDDSSLTPAFEDAYNDLIKHLREIVRDLRPASLSFGLKPAIEELAFNLMDRSENKVSVTVNLETDECRYSQNVEQHLFRIMQEACMNAVRHAKPTEILVSGRLYPQLVEISIVDNGAGFDIDANRDLTILQDNNHFGLAGMYERSELIGAALRIVSSPQKGTRVELQWKPDMQQ
jgi:signal transduction histidine kinase